MDRTRYQLFSSAALALNQDRRAARSGLNDQIEDLAHSGTATDDIRELVIPLLDVLPEIPVLMHEPSPFHGVADDDEHFFVLEWLGDVVERAGLHRRYRALDG